MTNAEIKELIAQIQSSTNDSDHDNDALILALCTDVLTARAAYHKVCTVVRTIHTTIENGPWVGE